MTLEQEPHVDEPSAPDEISRIASWMTRTLREVVVPATVERVGGFSHDALALETAGGRRIFVRLAPDDGPYPPYDLAREARLLTALPGTVAAPRVVAYHDGREAQTRAFIALEWLDGTVEIPVRSGRDPAVSRRLAADLVGALVCVHSVDPARTGLSREARPHGVRVLDRWGNVLDGLGSPPPPALQYAQWWLRENRPQDSAAGLVHGDFRLGNLMWCDDDVVVLDWESATIGDPLFDLGWLCMGAVDAEDLVMGLIPKRELIERYEQAIGRPVDRDRLAWWEALAVWQRFCMEARGVEYELGQAVPDLRMLLWEIGSHRTALELLERIDRVQTPGPVVAS